MSLSAAAINILSQLRDMVQQIRETDLSRPSRTLSGSTIGQHVRHTTEFFLCLRSGMPDGVVNYDKRAHDRLIETDKLHALRSIEEAVEFARSLEREQPLKLEVGYDSVKEEYIAVQTNTMRELVYNVEHAVHHMAIIKIGVREIAPYVVLSDHFGVAASTLRFVTSQAALHTR